MLCVTECYLDNEIAECGCFTSNHVYFQEDNSRECGILDMLLCPIKEVDIRSKCTLKNIQGISFLINFFSEKCLNECKPHCSFTKYEFAMISTHFPSPDFAQLARALDASSNATQQYMRKNYAELTVFMEIMSLDTTIIFKKYDLLKVISNTGGLLGILPGGSLLTLYELMEFAVTSALLLSKNSSSTAL